MRARWIIFQAVSSVWGTEIQKWVHIDLIIKYAESAANNQVFSARWLIGKTNPGGKVILIGRKDRVNAIALNLDAACRGDEYRKVFVATV